MRGISVYMNGIWSNFLEEITEVQCKHPTQTLFLQPTGNRVIKRLKDTSPSPEDPVIMYASITEDLSNVHYTAEIVGWDDKYKLRGKELERVERLICNFQKAEQYGVFEGAVNLIHVRNMRRFAEPFPVTKLVKISDENPLSGNRTRPGGFSYVKPLSDTPPYADC